MDDDDDGMNSDDGAAGQGGHVHEVVVRYKLWDFFF